MDVIFVTSGVQARIACGPNDSVAMICSRLQIEFGVLPQAQSLLGGSYGDDGSVTVRELSVTSAKGQPATLHDYGLELPLKPNVKIFLLDKNFMQARAVARAEKLKRFYEGSLVRAENLKDMSALRGAVVTIIKVCQLQRGQLQEQKTRLQNRGRGCEAALRLLGNKADGFRVSLADFEKRWADMASRMPELLEAAPADVERLKSTPVRPELALKVGRTLWDLYAQSSEEDIFMLVRKTQREHDTLAVKIRTCLEASHSALKDAETLQQRKVDLSEELDQPLEGIARLMEITLPQLERKVHQEPCDVAAVTAELLKSATEYDKWVSAAEAAVNNHVLNVQMRLQSVSSLVASIWQQREQIRGVLGMAMQQLQQRFHALLIIHEFPAMQDALAEEAIARALFRKRIDATLNVVENAMEPLLVDEINRRAGFLHDKHPYLREFLMSRFTWIKDEPLSVHLPSPQYKSPLPDGAYVVLRQINPFPLFKEPEEKGQVVSEKGKEEAVEDVKEEPLVGSGGDGGAAVNQQLLEQYEERIRHLEAQLQKQMDRSLFMVQKLIETSHTKEEKLLEENTMLRSELTGMEQSLSMMKEREEQHSEVVARAMSEERLAVQAPPPPPEEPVRKVYVASDFKVGDRVAFVRNAAKMYVAVATTENVFLSEASLAVVAQTKKDAMPMCILGLVIIEPATMIADDRYNPFGLRDGTLFTELTVELEQLV